jgi:hypothetical protein
MRPAGTALSGLLAAAVVFGCAPPGETVNPGGTGGKSASGGTVGTGGSGAGATGPGSGGANGSGGASVSGGGATGSGGGSSSGGATTTSGGVTGTAGRMAGSGGQGGVTTGGGGTPGSGGTTGGGGGGPTGGGPPGGCGREDCGASCAIPALPAMSALTANDKLPDPFKMISGTRITTKAEWQCRRAEISAQIQNYEAGKKNPKAAGAVTGSVSNDTLTVTVGGKSFTVGLKLPSGAGPFPAIVYLDSLSIPGNLANVAQIEFSTNKMGNQTGSRGTGFFFDVNGDKSVGALMAWAWGVSRVIDALEVTPAAKIDPKRVAVTGCSRNGKGALMIGAFDERIALTIPQESGSGGTALWRVSYAEDASFGGTMGNHKVQTIDSAYSEQPWFGTALQQFATTANVNKLPFDHHQLLGLVAPRGLMILDNTDYQWLGVNSVATGAAAAQPVFQALGVPDNIGFANSGHTHCSPNTAEAPYVDAFIKKFLLGQSDTDTKVWKVSKAAFGTSTATVDKAKWIDWTTPALN